MERKQLNSLVKKIRTATKDLPGDLIMDKSVGDQFFNASYKKGSIRSGAIHVALSDSYAEALKKVDYFIKAVTS